MTRDNLIEEFEQKQERSVFCENSGIGDMYPERGSYCNEYVYFLEQKLINKAGYINEDTINAASRESFYLSFFSRYVDFSTDIFKSHDIGFKLGVEFIKAHF